MSTPETIAVVALWIVAAAILLLLLLLYRQVDSAYGSNESNQSTALLPGVELPPVEIMTPAGPDFLDLPADPELSILAFLGSDCDRCAQLEETLTKEPVFDGLANCLFVSATPNGEPIGQRPDDTETVRFYSAAYAPDVPRTFGVNSVPLVYVLQGRTVLAAHSAADHRELAELLDAAREQRAALATEVGEAARS